MIYSLTSAPCRTNWLILPATLWAMKPNVWSRANFSGTFVYQVIPSWYWKHSDTNLISDLWPGSVTDDTQEDSTGFTVTECNWIVLFWSNNMICKGIKTKPTDDKWALWETNCKIMYSSAVCSLHLKLKSSK